ncbi:hypothetical protein ANN_04525 [Periplaneta americana]|uniref:Uncharacterized protein n=1 Tax=Periplaneta americana TaxID=6978 RepID=A0ABQ8T9J7_PERAM|nr:hypothetical protein ANN_04525 [Periplaneta americana]
MRTPNDRLELVRGRLADNGADMEREATGTLCFSRDDDDDDDDDNDDDENLVGISTYSSYCPISAAYLIMYICMYV